MTARTPRSIFEKFTMDTPEDENAFAKTHVPVRLASYGPEGIVSRSQARRVLSRFEKFKEVMLDFSGVDSIGQPFADEIFRVFKNGHPEIKVVAVHTNPAIDRMIRHVDKAAK